MPTPYNDQQALERERDELSARLVQQTIEAAGQALRDHLRSSIA
jgi:hypothetical protein